MKTITFNRKNLGTGAVALALVFGAAQASALSLGGIHLLGESSDTTSSKTTTQSNAQVEAKTDASLQSNTQSRNESQNSNPNESSIDQTTGARVGLTADTRATTDSSTHTDSNSSSQDTNLSNMLGLDLMLQANAEGGNSVVTDVPDENEASTSDNSTDSTFFSRVGLWFKSMFDLNSSTESNSMSYR